MKVRAKSNALSLRQRGISIKEIAKKVGVSKSTASRWCSGILLTESQQLKLIARRREAGIKALTPWIQKNRELKKTDIEKQKKLGYRDLGRIKKRDLFMLGLGLYWGEGYKRGSQEWGFTNSDSKMITVILLWLRIYYDVPIENIIARLTINYRYKDQEKDLLNTWSQETHIPISQFGKSTFIHGYTASKLHARTYRGTLRIKVRRGTSLRRRILASIAGVGNQIALNSRKTAS